MQVSSDGEQDDTRLFVVLVTVKVHITNPAVYGRKVLDEPCTRLLGISAT